MSRVSAILAVFLLLVGCTTSTVTKSTPPAQSIDIRSGAVYVYSFLDLREGSFGPAMLAATDRQMVSRFTALGVTAKTLKFKQTPIGRYFPITPATSDIPVEQVIAANAADEAASGARYRLVVFPISAEINGAWFEYSVRWDLVDIASHRKVWSVKTQGRTVNIWTVDEDSENRAKTFLDSFFNEWKSAGIR